MAETNWERLFGTPERTASFIVRNCCSDCLACHMPQEAPCYGEFYTDEADVPKVLEWLESEAE